MRILWMFLASASLLGCTTQDESAPIPADAQQRKGEAALDIAEEQPDRPGVAASPSAPFLARRSGSSSVPEAIASGTFDAIDGCVTFTPAGAASAYLALLPSSAALWVESGAAVGLNLAGKKVRFGEVARISGGSVPTSASASLGLAGKVPQGCPGETYAIGGLL